MPIVTDSNWVRTLEPLYEGTEQVGIPLAGVTAGTTTYAQYVASYYTWKPGYVAAVTSGTIVKATSGTSSGSFWGLMFSEVNATLDEVVGPALTPTVMTGPGTMKVLNAALDTTSYTYTLSATQAENELIAISGILAPRSTNTTAKTVGIMTAVEDDGITLELMHPSTSV